MISDLDELMDKDPLELTREDKTKIIGYYRERRAKMEAGEKPKRAKRDTGPTASVSLASLGLAKPKEEVKRRV